MEDFTTKHPADAAPEELTEGQRVTRALFPKLAADQDARRCVCGCGSTPTPEEVATWTPAGQREWNISGMAEPCFDRTFAPPPRPTPEELPAAVAASLDSAVANGYDLPDWTALQIAEDMAEYDSAVEGIPVEELLPHVEAWLATTLLRSEDLSSPLDSPATSGEPSVPPSEEAR